MLSFETSKEAKSFVKKYVDVPVKDEIIRLSDMMLLQTTSRRLDGETFTNDFDLSFEVGSVKPGIEVCNPLSSVFDHVEDSKKVHAAVSGGFFFLADRYSSVPRQLALNLAIANRQVYSLPVVDREAVVVESNSISSQTVQALGTMCVEGKSGITWSGSLTGHKTKIKVFGNGNCGIRHENDEATGTVRVLNEDSRFTPEITDDDIVDVGFIRREDGVFDGVCSSSSGKMDIFSHDMVARMHESLIGKKLPSVVIETLGDKAIGGCLKGALSVGPMICEEDFTGHPVNKDKSLGEKPPFLEIALARVVLYKASKEERVHVRLFDGRPGSPTFPGVTPQQAAEIVRSDGPIEWGCFLDPGQTAKLVTRDASYGNRHYLKWPSEPGDNYIWVPNKGRPVGSILTFS